MKTTILLSGVILPVILSGQITDHFSQPDTKWNVAKTYPAGNLENPDFVATTTTVYGYQGDTLINNQQWFKLYSTRDSAFLENLVYCGLIRTVDNMVFFRDTLNQPDTLYDFNLNVGDSVLFNIYGLYPEKIPVIAIDSIEIKDVFYRRFIFAEPEITAFDVMNEIWIEGVGSIHGPLFPYFPVKFSEEIPDSMLLTCTFSDNEQIWHHPAYSVCYLNIVLGLETPEAADLKIFPNPATDRLWISIPEELPLAGLSVEVFNISGRSISTTRPASHTFSIETGHLPAGLFLIRIIAGERLFTAKFTVKGV